MSIRSERKHNRGIRFTALWVAFVFTVTSVTWNTPASAAPAEVMLADILPIDQLAIPEEMGTITKINGVPGPRAMVLENDKPIVDRGPGFEDRFVVLIQDAHAVIDAQENIRKILGYLGKTYGVRLAALEGVKGRLEPILLKTFPEPAAKRKILAGYEDRAELSGPEIAAVMQEESGEYRGMEDWKLYEKNYFAYLHAQEKKPALLAKWNAFKLTLDQERPKVYDPKLNEFQEARENFLTERATLLDLLVYLSEFKGLFTESSKPSVSQGLQKKVVIPAQAGIQSVDSRLKHSGMTNGANEDNDGDSYQELSGLIASIGYEKAGKQEALAPLVRKIADEFKIKYLRGLGVKTEMNFYNRYQTFMTGQITAGQMLQYLVQLGRENGKNVKLTPALKKLLGHAELLSEIKGSRLYDELQRFLPEVESSLIKTPAQRELADKYQKLYLLKEMITLELTHEALAKYQKEPEAYLSLMPESSFGQDLAPALEFYKAALERDHAFYKNIQAMMQKRPATIAVVAGGFHTEGLKRLLEENRIHYAVVTPKMASLAGLENYAKVMKGEVSFKDYLTPQDVSSEGVILSEVPSGTKSKDLPKETLRFRPVQQGSTQGKWAGKTSRPTYFDALMRHAAKTLTEALPLPDRVRTLKTWRDNVIRELAKEGRITDAGKFLPYIDELLQSNGEAVSVGPKRTKEEILDIVRKELEKFKTDSLERIWKTFEFQLGAFTDGLKELISKKDLNTQSVSTLLDRASQTQPSFIPPQRGLDPEGGRAVFTLAPALGEAYDVRGATQTRLPITLAGERYAARSESREGKKPGTDTGLAESWTDLPPLDFEEEPEAAPRPLRGINTEEEASINAFLEALQKPAAEVPGAVVALGYQRIQDAIVAMGSDETSSPASVRLGRALWGLEAGQKKALIDAFERERQKPGASGWGRLFFMLLNSIFSDRVLQVRLREGLNHSPEVERGPEVTRKSDDLFKIGKEQDISAHGVSRENGGIRNLLNIILGGSIRTSKNGSFGEEVYTGPLHSFGGHGAGDHGPFYVVLKDGYRNTQAIGREYHEAYLVENPDQKEWILDAIRKADKAGLLERDGLSLDRILTMVMTYDDFIASRSRAEIREAKQPGLMKRLTRAARILTPVALSLFSLPALGSQQVARQKIAATKIVATNVRNFIGDDIGGFQKMLADRGYYQGPLDKLWGPKMELATSKWMKDQGLSGIGKPGIQTVGTRSVTPVATALDVDTIGGPWQGNPFDMADLAAQMLMPQSGPPDASGPMVVKVEKKARSVSPSSVAGEKSVLSAKPSLTKDPLVVQLGLPKYATCYTHLSDGYERFGRQLWPNATKKDLVCLGMVLDRAKQDPVGEAEARDVEARKQSERNLGTMRTGISITEGGKNLAANQKKGPAASTEMIEPRSAIDAVLYAKNSKKGDLRKVLYDGLAADEAAFLKSLFEKKSPNEPKNRALMKDFLQRGDFQNRVIILYLYQRLAIHNLPLPSAGHIEQQAGTYQIAWAPGIFEYSRTLAMFLYANQVYDLLDKMSEGETVSQMDIRRLRQVDSFSTYIESVAASMRRAQVEKSKKGDQTAAGIHMTMAQRKLTQLRQVAGQFDLVPNKEFFIHASEFEFRNRSNRLAAGGVPQSLDDRPPTNYVRSLALGPIAIMQATVFPFGIEAKPKTIPQASRRRSEMREAVSKDLPEQIVWLAGSKKQGPRVAWAQLREAEFDVTTQRIAGIVEGMKERYGDGAPDLITFPEGIDEVNGLGKYTRAREMAREAVMTDIVRRTKIATGYALERIPENKGYEYSEVSYVILLPEADGTVRKIEFKKYKQGEESRLINVNGLHIAFLICKECSSVLSNLSSEDKLFKDLFGADLIMVPAGSDMFETRLWAQRLSRKFNNKPVALVNFGGGEVLRRATSGYVAPDGNGELTETLLTGQDGILVADIMPQVRAEMRRPVNEAFMSGVIDAWAKVNKLAPRAELAPLDAKNVKYLRAPEQKNSFVFIGDSLDFGKAIAAWAGLIDGTEEGYTWMKKVADGRWNIKPAKRRSFVNDAMLAVSSLEENVNQHAHGIGAVLVHYDEAAGEGYLAVVDNGEGFPVNKQTGKLAIGLAPGGFVTPYHGDGIALGRVVKLSDVAIISHGQAAEIKKGETVARTVESYNYDGTGAGDVAKFKGSAVIVRIPAVRSEARGGYEELDAVLPREKVLSEHRSAVLNDLGRVGQEKNVGYVSLDVIQGVKSEVEAWAKGRGLATLEIRYEEGALEGSGAFYVYDPSALAALLVAHHDVLIRAGIPTEPAGFVLFIAKNVITDLPAARVVALAFNDQPRARMLANLARAAGPSPGGTATPVKSASSTLREQQVLTGRRAVKDWIVQNTGDADLVRLLTTLRDDLGIEGKKQEFLKKFVVPVTPGPEKQFMVVSSTEDGVRIHAILESEVEVSAPQAEPLSGDGTYFREVSLDAAKDLFRDGFFVLPGQVFSVVDETLSRDLALSHFAGEGKREVSDKTRIVLAFKIPNRRIQIQIRGALKQKQSWAAIRFAFEETGHKLPEVLARKMKDTIDRSQPGQGIARMLYEADKAGLLSSLGPETVDGVKTLELNQARKDAGELSQAALDALKPLVDAMIAPRSEVRAASSEASLAQRRALGQQSLQEYIHDPSVPFEKIVVSDPAEVSKLASEAYKKIQAIGYPSGDVIAESYNPENVDDQCLIFQGPALKIIVFKMFPQTTVGGNVRKELYFGKADSDPYVFSVVNAGGEMVSHGYLGLRHDVYYHNPPVLRFRYSVHGATRNIPGPDRFAGQGYGTEILAGLGLIATKGGLFPEKIEELRYIITRDDEPGLATDFQKMKEFLVRRGFADRSRGEKSSELVFYIREPRLFNADVLAGDIAATLLDPTRSDGIRDVTAFLNEGRVLRANTDPWGQRDDDLLTIDRYAQEFALKAGMTVPKDMNWEAFGARILEKMNPSRAKAKVVGEIKPATSDQTLPVGRQGQATEKRAEMREALNTKEREIVDQARRTVFKSSFRAAEQAMERGQLYTEVSLSKVQKGPYGSHSILERMADRNRKPAVFHSLSLAIYPEDGTQLKARLLSLTEDFLRQLPFAEQKFFITSPQAYHLTLQPVAKVHKEPYRDEDVIHAKINAAQIAGELKPFDLWVQGVTIDPANGRIQIEGVFLDGKKPARRIITLYAPVQELTFEERQQLSQWVHTHRDDIFGRMYVDKLYLVHSKNIFANKNIFKQEYRLGKTRTEKRAEMRLGELAEVNPADVVKNGMKAIEGIKARAEMKRAEMRGVTPFKTILSFNKGTLSDPRKWERSALDEKYYAEMSQWDAEKLGTELRAFFGDGVLVPINDAALLNISSGGEFLRKFIDHLINGNDDGFKKNVGGQPGWGMDHYWNPANSPSNSILAFAIMSQYSEREFLESRSRYRAFLIRLVEYWDELAAQRSTPTVQKKQTSRAPIKGKETVSLSGLVDVRPADVVKNGMKAIEGIKARAEVRRVEIGKSVDVEVSEFIGEISRKKNPEEYLRSEDFRKDFNNKMPVLVSIVSREEIDGVITTIRTGILIPSGVTQVQGMVDAMPLREADIRELTARIDAKTAGLKSPKITAITSHPGADAEDFLKSLGGAKLDRLIVLHRKDQPMGGAWRNIGIPVTALTIGRKEAKTLAQDAVKGAQGNREITVGFWPADLSVGDLGILSMLAEIGQLSNPELKALVFATAKLVFSIYASASPERRDEFRANPGLLTTAVEKMINSKIPGLTGKNGMLVFEMAQLVQAFATKESIESAA